MKATDSELKTREGEPIAFWLTSRPEATYKTSSGRVIVFAPASDSEVFVDGIKAGTYSANGYRANTTT